MASLRHVSHKTIDTALESAALMYLELTDRPFSTLIIPAAMPSHG
jgi:hypothetical protein